MSRPGLRGVTTFLEKGAEPMPSVRRDLWAGRRAAAALAGLAVLLAPAPGRTQDAPSPRPPGELVDVGGYRLHVHCTGKGGPAVVLIAGAGDFSFDWSLV